MEKVNYEVQHLETRKVVNWFEENMTFIKTYFKYISEVNVYNTTEILFKKKFYRIYVEIDARFPPTFKVPWSDYTPDYTSEQIRDIQNFQRSNPYLSYTGINEIYVAIHYEWIKEICKIRFRDAPFKYEIKDFHQADEHLKKYD